MSEPRTLIQLLCRHRIGTAFAGAALVGAVDGLGQLPFYAVLVSECVYVMLVVPWVMLEGDRG